MVKRFMNILLCLLMLLSLALPANAAEAEWKISTAEEFLQFAENCRLDSYSVGLRVSLQADIDLSGRKFDGIPLFSGSFDGNGHTISGLKLTSDGSAQGLFRVLTVSATVRDLCIQGEVSPGGSKNEIGGLVGRNEGLIRNCYFSGRVSGSDCVGGLVGSNFVTGIIEDCSAEGTISGDHFVGGIAGENYGVTRSCVSRASVNTASRQNEVELSDITVDTLTGTEAANTATDIGGIAGISSGVIRSCENYGNVGYPHMGYNIGGIAGTQSGYIAECKNYGTICGRKEVGGIVGQMEPTALLEYSQDTLQILQEQLGTMSALVSRASGNAQSNAGQISGQIGALQLQTQTARDAVDSLVPDAQNPVLPDLDAVLAAQNTLAATFQTMPETMRGIVSSTQITLNTLVYDLKAISDQLSTMGQTVQAAGETLGGSITDVSDGDTPDLLTGKAEDCVNYGTVLADLNTGGIAGAIAVENDLDIAEDWLLSGETSMNFQGELRAVLLYCENQGTVTGEKQNVGGIVGWQPMGLVKGCINTGTVEGEDADYVGGIAGLSTGFVRSNYARCVLRGRTCVGGIAGSASIVTDCVCQVRILNGSEKLGAILGVAAQTGDREEVPISGNYYLSMEEDIGAIDAISYAGAAEPLALKDFLALEGLPAAFQTVTLCFLYPDGTTEEITVAPGTPVSPAELPVIPEREGYTGKWDGLERADLSCVYFDLTFEAVYTAYSPVIESSQTGEKGRPLVLAEGSFSQQAKVEISDTQNRPSIAEGERLLGSWTVQMKESGNTLRLLLPQEADGQNVRLLLLEDGQWQSVPFRQEGSYLVFSCGQQEVQMALVQGAETDLWIAAGIGAAVLTLFLSVFAICRKHRAKKKAAALQAEV